MENVILEGRIVQKLDVQEGVSTRGAWKKQDFIIETADQYPKKICICCWNEKIDELAQYQLNDAIRASVNIESREYNSRWYTDIKAWRLERASSTAGDSPASNDISAPKTAGDVIGVSFSDDDDELPF